MLRTIPLVCLLLSIPLASASVAPISLFTDPTGDAGPGAVWGAPIATLGSDHADLTGATLIVDAETATLSLRLAALPAQLPNDVVWAAGWTASNGSFLSAAYFRIVDAEHPNGVEGTAVCWYKEGPQTGERPACADINATRVANGFDLAIPLADLGDGILGSPGAAVVWIPDATAWPLFVAHFTGMTVEDFASGANVTIPLPSPAPIVAQSVAAGSPARTVPAPTGILVVGLVAGIALLSRKKS